MVFAPSRGGGGGAMVADGIDLRPGGRLYKGRAPPILQGQLSTAHHDSSFIIKELPPPRCAKLMPASAWPRARPRTVPSTV